MHYLFMDVCLCWFGQYQEVFVLMLEQTTVKGGENLIGLEFGSSQFYIGLFFYHSQL